MSQRLEDGDSHDGGEGISKVPVLALGAFFLFFFLVKLETVPLSSTGIAAVSGEATGLCLIPGGLVWLYHKNGSSGYYWSSLIFMGLMAYAQVSILMGR